jgi:hypothetical protein
VRLTLIQLSTFAAKWSKLKLNDNDLRALEQMFLVDPAAGKVIAGTGGLRKLRFAPPSWHTGKRGAVRVVYAFIGSANAVYMFTLYAKNEASDLAADGKKVFRSVLERLYRWHAGS